MYTGMIVKTFNTINLKYLVKMCQKLKTSGQELIVCGFLNQATYKIAP